LTPSLQSKSGRQWFPGTLGEPTPQTRRRPKSIGRYDNATPALVVVRQDLDEPLGKALRDALVSWVPEWEAVYGAFRLLYYADVQSFFHDLDQLPPDR
jgi:phosphonate transport system substrate-binding protein